jgi:hypothetical protein
MNGCSGSLTACERLGIVPRIIVLVLTFVLAAAGCSGSSALDKVSVGATAGAPKVTIPENFSVDKTTTKIIKQGSGDKLATGDLAKIAFVAYNGRTGKQFDTSYGGRTPLTVDLTKDKSLAGFVKALKGQRVGTPSSRRSRRSMVLARRAPRWA